MAIKWKTDNMHEKKTESIYGDKNTYGKKGTWIGLVLVILCSLIAGAVMLYSCPGFYNNAQTIIKEAEEKEKKESQKQTELAWDSSLKEDILFVIYYLNYELGDQKDAFSYFTQNYDTAKLNEEEKKALQVSSDLLLRYLRDAYNVLTLKENVSGENSYIYTGNYCYSCYGAVLDGNHIIKKEYGVDKNLYLTAVSQGLSSEIDTLKEQYEAAFVLTYDENGNPSVTDSWNLKGDTVQIASYLKSAGVSDLDFNDAWDILARDNEIWDTFETENDGHEFYLNAMLLKQIPLPAIRNTTFVIGIQNRMVSEDEDAMYHKSYVIQQDAWLLHGYLITAILIAMIMAVLPLILQNISWLGLRERQIFRFPTELYLLFACIGILLASMMAYSAEFARVTMGKDLSEVFTKIGFGGYSDYLAQGLLWLLWSLYSFFWYWLSATLLPYLTHPVKNLKEHMLIPKIYRWVKKEIRALFRWATEIDLMEKDGKLLRRIIFVNGIVIVLLCCCWFWGIFLAVIYSLILYVYLKRKYQRVHEDYTNLLLKTKRIASGEAEEGRLDESSSNLHEDKEGNKPPKYQNTDERDNTFYRVSEELDRIQAGLKKAIHAEVRSRNMKTELITNVSHDLKTPLTAIITYLDLLKQENLSEEERAEYIDTLDQKAQRLKLLIEDLFEVSKAVTGDIVMNYTEVDLTSLIKQVRLENEDRIKDSTLDFRWNLFEEKRLLMLDPNRTYRIMDNLLQNVLRYSMPYTRVYIDMEENKKWVSVIMKNISASEMNFKAEEITDRFVRGDLARNTEGSGLGLAIARSFTELQGGDFNIEIDGDLFKAVVKFPMP